MPRTWFVATGLLLGSLCMVLPAFAATAGALPAEQTQGSVTYVSGGIGQEEAQAFEVAAAHYPLTLEFAIKHAPHAEFIADVHVIVTDARGQHMLDTHSDGPFLLARLPVGRYTVTAEHQGQTLTKTIQVAPAKSAHALFLWAA
jgi:hypothetical protein